MALLGKTLNGRTTKPGGIKQKRNIKIRKIVKSQQEFEESQKQAQFKKEQLRSKIREEQKIVNFNTKKLMDYWRRTMRAVKTEHLKLDIEQYSQNIKRELDSKEAFIQMLDINLDESEDQYQIALRNHLYNARNQALKKEKENIAKSYQDLKLKMNKFRDEQSKLLKEWVNNSRNAVLKLAEYKELELCRRLKTEREKVMPFYSTQMQLQGQRIGPFQ